MGDLKRPGPEATTDVNHTEILRVTDAEAKYFTSTWEYYKPVTYELLRGRYMVSHFIIITRRFIFLGDTPDNILPVTDQTRVQFLSRSNVIPTYARPHVVHFRTIS